MMNELQIHYDIQLRAISDIYASSATIWAQLVFLAPTTA
jgi:hypothetical protein